MKAFLSSTYRDLADHRLKAAEAIERLGQQGIRMEVFGARPDDATTVCRNEIDGADLVVGIYAHRYGYVEPGQDTSITELEYDYAVARKKPVFCFVIDPDHPWRPADIEDDPGRAKLRLFKSKIDKGIVRDSFTTPDDLAFKVASSVGRYLITRTVKDALDAASHYQSVGPDEARNQVSRRAARLFAMLSGARVLLVNDVPREMSHVVKIYERLGMAVSIVKNSKDAMRHLESDHYDVVVSDMSRDGVDDEGSRFLRRIREAGTYRPTIITLGQFDPSRGSPPYAFGITNRVDELLNLTFDIIERERG